MLRKEQDATADGPFVHYDGVTFPDKILCALKLL